MKVIKKITAIMLSIMMVLGMCSVVGAAETETEEKGTITIENAISGQTYKIYKILTLESYEPKKDTDGKEIGLYSYKPAKGWETFFGKSGKGSKYVDINENGYVTWKTGEDKAKAAELAQAALEYATANVGKEVFDETNDIHETTAPGESGAKVSLTFENLPLGYYLVDSSAGALCSLDTTNKDVTIQEKNGVPTVDKQVASNGSNYSNVSYANIGDEVSFQITIDVKKGAYNYKLYDKMSKGFKLKDPMNTITNSTLQVHAADSEGTFYDTLKEDQDYTLTKNSDGFTVEFKNEYLKTHETVEYKIVVSYIAILTGDAEIGNSGVGNTNETYLTYGDKNTESQHSTTNTYTFGIPVFKYTGANTPLAGAKFSLYSDESCTNIITLIKPEAGETYRRFIEGTDDINKKVTVIETTSAGEFNITGLNLGTYYLKEIEAPKGYNKLNNAIVVKIEKSIDGATFVNLFQDGSATTKVNVENKSGSLLPSTGGMGTTIFYIAGAFLVLISGVVLIAKKRTDSK